MSEPGDGGEWRARGRLFDGRSHEYQEGRPGYPAAVFRLLRQRCGLGSGSQVLEIGPGSGQATLPMLRLGAQVTAVEPGAGLADRLVEQAGSADLTVIISSFEDAEVPDHRFDLVVSDVENLARNEFGGVVTRPYRTVLYLAPRQPR